MEFNWSFLIPIGIVYVLITGYLYVKRVRFRWFGLYPFGITFYFFNRPLEWLGEKFSRLWIIVGALAYFVFGYLIIGLIILLPFSILIYWLQIDPLVQLIDPFRLYLVEVLRSLDFTSVVFYAVALFSIGAHEFMHGVVAKANGIPIENTGIIGIPFLLFAAYVKIDFFGFLKDETQKRKEELRDQDKPEPEEPIETESEEEIKPWIYIDYNGDVVDPPPQETEPEQPIPYIDNSAKELLPPLPETQEEEYIDPFLIDDQEIRNRLAFTQSAGLLANLFFFAVAYYLLQHPILLSSQYENLIVDVLQNMISINLYLILLNLLPFRLFDGGKIFMNKLLDLTTANRAGMIIGFFDRMFLFLIILAVIA